ncbi:Lrp/AsnC family transcriptional regulator [Actinocorallia sp. A-T 12471]|uniref:Lrp/AsnC family transcriptional regulator n=1 Tax=Actinocorallia sp. A-T 12471 TaxID=3089813 RepID=UPI0029D2EE05|nr:Lrp/AsnC family transcriptional regulator [Actinocorallia sp. A-T 12471]MDX6744063.1 Lrp/AsnC family transcriptional regulator [Actinocorallia sp. A-T 12471]
MPPDPLLESADLDELDFLLVAALQRSPRADWVTIGAALGVDASTAARRWARLTGAGLAWLTCYPTALPGAHPIVAMIEIDCVRGRTHEVAAELADDPHLFTIEHVTGRRDLLVTAIFGDQAELARYVGFRLGALPGVAATRTDLATTLHAEGSRWRLERAGGREGGNTIPGPGTRASEAPPGRPGSGGLTAADLRLIKVLGEDVRQSAASLAAKTGLSQTTVRRRLARLEREGSIAYRCEVARSRSGWPVSVTFWATVPAHRVAEVTARLAGRRETRMCVSLSGAHNMLFTVWLRSIDAIPAFEASLAEHSPDLVVTDRAVALWILKFAGRLLDPLGRHLRAVPLTSWTPGAAAEAEGALLRRLAEGPPRP